MNPYNTPDLAPRFQSEIDNYDLASSVQNQALDPRALALRRQAGPHSNFYQNQDQDMAAQDMRNKATVFRNRTMQGASDRDLQWRAQQEDRNWQHGALDRQMAAQEDQTKYLRQRDTKNDENADKQARLNYAMAKINSPDELVRAEGQDEYERLIGGGSAATPSSPAPVAGAVSRPASTASDGYYENTGVPSVPATGTADPVNSRMAIALKEREARLAHQAELDRQQSRNANADFEEKQFANSERRHSAQRADKFKVFQARLDRTQDPSQVTDIMNQMAGENASLAPMVNQPRGMMGIGDAVGDALKSAYGTADQAGQSDAVGAFRTDPLEQAQYDARKKRGVSSLGQEQGFADVADAQKVLQSDPQVSNAIGSLKRELTSMGSPSWGIKALNALDSLATLGLDSDESNAARSRIGDARVSQFAQKVQSIAESVAARYPGMSAEAVHQAILSQIGGALQGDGFNDTRRDQFSDALYAPPAASAAPAAGGSAVGPKASRFARIGKDLTPGGM